MPVSSSAITGMNMTITSDFDAFPGGYSGGMSSGSPTGMAGGLSMDGFALLQKLDLITSLPQIFRMALDNMAQTMEEEIKSSIINQTGGWDTRSGKSHYTKWKRKNYPENADKALMASGDYYNSITKKTEDRGENNFSIGVTCDPPEFIPLATLLEDGGTADQVDMPHKYPNADRAGHKIIMPPRPHWKPVFDENVQEFDRYFNDLVKNSLFNKYGSTATAMASSKAFAGAVKTGSGWTTLGGKSIPRPTYTHKTSFTRGGRSVSAWRSTSGRFTKGPR